VVQIFGRAGRPQFDTSGEGVIITTHEKLAHYLRLMTHQLPIESQFIASLRDNLNAEVVLGTVTTIKEAITWLSYTYLSVRMRMSEAPSDGNSRSLCMIESPGDVHCRRLWSRGRSFGGIWTWFAGKDALCLNPHSRVFHSARHSCRPVVHIHCC
jgi:hypothetical protein